MVLRLALMMDGYRATRDHLEEFRETLDEVLPGEVFMLIAFAMVLFSAAIRGLTLKRLLSWLNWE